MKKVIGAIFCFIFTYLMFAFGAWDINAGNWSMDARAVAVVSALAWSVITIIYVDVEAKVRGEK